MLAHNHKLINFALLAALFMYSMCRAATETETTQVNAEAPRALPAYKYPYSNPLYATLAGYLEVGNVIVPGEQKLNLSVEKFSKPMPVHAVIQDHSAPLVVFLPGISARADASFTKLWPSFFAEAGYHVLWFDSTFRPEFVDAANRGVSGNVWSESQSAAEIIATFLKLERLQGRVAKVGIVGMSYGAIEALILGRMASAGKLPFEIAAIQAYSPPLDFQRTGEILDTWYSEDRWNYTLAELSSTVGGHVPEPCECIPFSDSMMRAAITASFHEELVPVVLRSDAKYHLNVLPHGNEFTEAEVRREYADAWGYVKYAYDLALPYWECRIGKGAVDKLIVDTRAVELLRGQPAYVETIIAKDDPFDTQADMDEFLSATARQNVTVLGRGGHLGYVGNDWTRAKLLSIFPEAQGPLLMSVSADCPTQPGTYPTHWRKTKKKGFFSAIFGQ
jgi:predicted alpha/beta-fold hydrolase